MASPTYLKLKAEITPYLGEEKATACIERNLPRCNATADTFNDANFKEILFYIIGATTVYLRSEEAKLNELTAKLKALSG